MELQPTTHTENAHHELNAPAYDVPEASMTRSQPKRSNWKFVVRDATIGFADGLTVPFALTAGISSLGSRRLVVLAGLVELFSGAISMGLGAWLAAITEFQQYRFEKNRLESEVARDLMARDKDVHNMLRGYWIGSGTANALMNDLHHHPGVMVDFILYIVERMEQPGAFRALASAIVMGVAYFVAGIIPMIPYFTVTSIDHALFVSIGITVVLLTSFGYAKSILVIPSKKIAIFSMLQTLVVGIIAAGTSYGIVRGINSTKFSEG